MRVLLFIWLFFLWFCRPNLFTQPYYPLNEFSTAILHPKQILNTGLYALMREDTGTRKVYFLPLQDTLFTCQGTEHLLYDFSLQEGDSIDCGFVSAIRDLQEQPVILLAPNPARDIVTIQIDPAFRKEAELKVSLINTAGKLVLRTNWKVVQGLDIDLSGLPDGMYFLKAAGVRRSIIKKIMVTH